MICLKISLIFAILLHLDLATATGMSTFERQLEPNKNLTFFYKLQKHNYFSYAECEENKINATEVTCKLVNEHYSFQGDVRISSVYHTFYLPCKTYRLSLSDSWEWSLANRNIFLFAYWGNCGAANESNLVYRAIDVLSGQFNDVKVQIPSRSRLIYEFDAVVSISNSTFDLVSKFTLGDSVIWKMSFNTQGQLIQIPIPLSKCDSLYPINQPIYPTKFHHLKNIDEYLVVKNYWPRKAELAPRAIIVRASADKCEEIEKLEINYANEYKEYYDVASSLDHAAVCFRPDELASTRPKIRCFQFDSNWNKTLDVQLELTHPIDVLKIVNLKKGAIAALIHDFTSGHYYAKRIESHGRHGESLLIHGLEDTAQFYGSIQFYYGDSLELCVMRLFGTWKLKRTCFNIAMVLDDINQEPALEYNPNLRF